MTWEAREKEIRDRVHAALRGSGLVAAQDAGDLLTEIVRLRNERATIGSPDPEKLRWIDNILKHEEQFDSCVDQPGRVHTAALELRKMVLERDLERAEIEALHPLLAGAFDKGPSLVPRVRAMVQCYGDARATEEYAIGLSHGTKRGATWLRAEIVRLEAEVVRAGQRCGECGGGGIIPSIGGLWSNCSTCGHRDDDE